MGNPPPANALAALLAPSSKVTSRVEIYEQDGVNRWTKDTVERLVSGSVSVDYSRDERRTIDLELDNSDFVLQNAPGEFWYDKVIKAYRGVQYKDKITTPTQYTRTNLITNPRMQSAGAAAVRRTNMCKNPGFEAGTTANVWRTNACLNPSMEATGATSTRRTNLCTNPSMETNVTGYTGTLGTVSQDATYAQVGTKSCKLAVTSNGNAFITMSRITSGFTTGQKMTVSVYSRGSAARNAYIAVNCFNASNAIVGTFYEANYTTLTASTSAFSRHYVTFTIPANTTQIEFYPIIVSNAVNGDSFWVDAVLAEISGVLENYFSGATAADADFTYAWTGTADASTSTMTGTVVSNWNVSNGVVHKDTLVSGLRWGTKAAKFRSFGVGTMYSTDITAAAGEVWSMSALLRSNGTVSGTWQMVIGAYNGGSLLASYNISLPATVGAFQRFGITTPALPTNTTKIICFPVYNTAVTTGEEWWVDAVLIEKTSDNTRPYFDGSSLPRERTNRCANPNFETNTSGWGGAIGYNAVTLTRDTTKYHSGTASMRVDWTYDGSHTKVAAAHVSCGADLVIGRAYTFSAWVYVPAGVSPVYASELFTSWGVSTQTTGAWERVYVTFTATATQHYFGLWTYTNAANGTFYIDDVMCEEVNNNSLPYFDGGSTTSQGYTYSWYGTANASISFQQNSSYTVAWTGTANASTSTISVKTPDLWTNSGSVAFREFTQYASRASSYRVEGNNAASAPYYDSGAGTLAASTNYSFSCRIYAPKALASDVQLVLNFYDNTGTFISAISSTVVTAGTTNTKFEKYGIYGTSPAGTDRCRLVFSSASLAQGEYFYVDEVLLEASETPGTYFDGATASDGDFAFAWTGTADASTSTASSSVPTGYAAAGNPAPIISQSTRYLHGAAAKSMMFMTTGTNVFFNSIGYDFTAVVGQTYIASCYVFIPVDSKVDFASLFFFGHFSDSNGVTTKKGEWVRLSQTVVADNTAMTVGFYAETTNTPANAKFDQRVYFSEVLLETGNILNPYFDGASVDAPNRSFVWTGAADASTSTETKTINIVTYAETLWEAQVGEFVIDRIDEDHFPHTVKITGRDYVKRCQLSKFTQATQFATGQTLEAIISTIATNAGITKKVLPPTGVTVNRAFFFDRGTDRWSAMKEIANAYNYDIFFDGQGFLRINVYNDPVLTASAFTFQTGLNGNMASYKKSTNDSRIYNHVLVTGDSSDPAIPPVYAEAKNTDASSPTSIAEIGDRLYQYASSFITTQAQAQTVANSFLAIHALEEYELNFDAVCLPWFDTGEIITWIDPRPASGDPDRFLLSSLSIPLGLGPMSASAKRIVVVNQ